MARRFLKQLTPQGRRRIAIEQAAIQAPTSRPGLHHVDDRGTVRTTGTITTPGQPPRDIPIELAYYRVGPAVNDDNHTTVVFVHGFTLAADSFFLQVDYLQQHYPEVTSLLVDIRGHGRTGEVQPELCTISGTADDVMATIAQHAPTGRLILVGHSLGGMTVLNLLRRADSTLRARIKGILLISTAIESLASQGLPQVLASPVANLVHQKLEVAPELAQSFRNDVAELLAPALAATVFYRDSTPYNIIEFHASMIHDTPLETIVGFFDDLQEHEETAASQYLSDIRGACVVGDKDHFTPVGQTELICKLWGCADKDILQDVGHMVILEDPESLNAYLGKLVGRTLPSLTGSTTHA
ncbi:hypothetical protein CAQU_08915 [Corynebacterium aquilae DSM 44791]|uniref:AB hydrolase-1 domain-containing protein n=1 Tax=Corynebacterium aquilae DSM 44791 TaxID=1431546 RepID=A0A1L7CH29_9CORY|nr:hypothetical protein CAQU_08915 [Corynebacterium aquilae DSM 44791]